MDTQSEARRNGKVEDKPKATSEEKSRVDLAVLKIRDQSLTSESSFEQNIPRVLQATVDQWEKDSTVGRLILSKFPASNSPPRPLGNSNCSGVPVSMLALGYSTSDGSLLPVARGVSSTPQVPCTETNGYNSPRPSIAPKRVDLYEHNRSSFTGTCNLAPVRKSPAEPADDFSHQDAPLDYSGYRTNPATSVHLNGQGEAIAPRNVASSTNDASYHNIVSEAQDSEEELDVEEVRGGGAIMMADTTAKAEPKSDEEKKKERRQRNNVAAKKSRDTKRLKMQILEVEAVVSTEENVKLKMELSNLNAEIASFHSILGLTAHNAFPLLQ